MVRGCQLMDSGRGKWAPLFQCNFGGHVTQQNRTNRSESAAITQIVQCKNHHNRRPVAFNKLARWARAATASVWFCAARSLAP